MTRPVHRRGLDQASLALLSLMLLQGCTLTANAWRRGLSHYRLRGGCTLFLEEVRFDDAADRLLLRFRAGRAAGYHTDHLPETGWLTLTARFGRDADLRSMVAQVDAAAFATPAISLQKLQKGSLVKWHARLDCRAGDVFQAALECDARPTIDRPSGASRALEPHRWPTSLRFDLYKRRRRAQLLAEAILLTPPLLVADFFWDCGRVLARTEWFPDGEDEDGGVLDDLVVGAVRATAKGIRNVVDHGRKHGDRDHEDAAPRRPPNRRQPTGPPKRNPR